MSKSRQFGFWAYFFCIVFIASAIFAIMGLIDMQQRKSATYGDGINIKYTYTQEQFSYAASSLIFSPYGQGFKAEVELLPVDNFNGEENTYLLYFCDFVCENIKTGMGFIQGTTTKEFYATDGNVYCTSTLKIKILFYERKALLIVECTDGTAAMTYWTAYFENYGVRVDVIEVGGENEKNNS